jgi:hypothetical protein
VTEYETAREARFLCKLVKRLRNGPLRGDLRYLFTDYVQKRRCTRRENAGEMKKAVTLVML